MLQTWTLPLFGCCSVAKLCSTLCDPMDCSLQGSSVYFRGTLSFGVSSNSCPLSRWRHPSILSCAAPFSSRLQSFPELGSFPSNRSLHRQNSSFIWDWWSFSPTTLSKGLSAALPSDPATFIILYLLINILDLFSTNFSPCFSPLTCTRQSEVPQHTSWKVYLYP